MNRKLLPAIGLVVLLVFFAVAFILLILNLGSSAKIDFPKINVNEYLILISIVCFSVGLIIYFYSQYEGLVSILNTSIVFYILSFPAVMWPLFSISLYLIETIIFLIFFIATILCSVGVSFVAKREEPTKSLNGYMIMISITFYLIAFGLLLKF